jgi:hypothetical protein
MGVLEAMARAAATSSWAGSQRRCTVPPGRPRAPWNAGWSAGLGALVKKIGVPVVRALVIGG